ncbi:hypothetical protein BV20DRAFT_1114311 [Pilatotrama ljubarskyi]|nr:hypothetical protein BV20DRAFT_1114311 [Pilatotrama ljubarskyi]
MARLKIDAVHPEFVRICRQKLVERCTADIDPLKQVEAAALELTPKELEWEVLEQREIYGVKDLPPEMRKSNAELDMYHPLQRIFDFIALFSVTEGEDSMDSKRRRFVRRTAMLLPEEPHSQLFPRFAPDFALIHGGLREGTPYIQSRHWTDRQGFVWLKPSPEQHPHPDAPNGLARPMLTEAANLARLHLSARPFSVFSVGLLIFGSDFCVCMFDRGGGQLSPRYNMWRELEVFVRVVRSMTCVLTDKELGCDPSVRSAPTSEQNAQDAGYPAFLIDPVGADTRRWCTVGAPLWSSLALFSRGTHIWRVREVIEGGELRGPVMVMKSSWRSSSSKCEPEATIYRSIRGGHPGLAKFVAGGDVTVRRQRFSEALTVHFLRGDVLKDGEHTLVLHRIVTEGVGRPVWEYRTEQELILGMLAALNAHKFLCAQGILHRDISAWNVLLAENPEEQGTAGFLIDLEYAHRTIRVKDRIEETVQPPSGYGPVRSDLREPMKRVHVRFESASQDSAITGTLHFMSCRLLRALERNKTSIEHTAEDDVESFYWVLIYAILRKLITTKVGTPEEQRRLVQTFREAYAVSPSGSQTMTRSLASPGEVHVHAS